MALRKVYEKDYTHWLERAGFSAVDHTDRFPILIGAFGYTRGNPNDPKESALVPFITDNDEFVVYGEIIETEAYLGQARPPTGSKLAR